LHATPSSQVIIVSGGSRGLGRAFVEDFLSHGHIVATFSRSKTPFVEELERRDPHGNSFCWRPVDVTDYDAVKAFVLATAHRYERIDGLVNNAAIAVDGPLALMQRSAVDDQVGMNLLGATYLTQACTRIMLTQQRGCIVNVSSVVGLRGYTGLSVYSATKAAFDGMTRSLARELGARGIRINSLAPGFIETDMSDRLAPRQREQIVRRTPLGRLGTLEDVVGVMRFLLSPAASYITGQTLIVDGGLTC
jgi:3-oxoacyl-[acyl-carrier protein] reductase